MALILLCEARNDLYGVLTRSGVACTRVSHVDEACALLGRATAESGLLVLADGYPQERTIVDARLLEAARQKQVRVYLEYPQALAGVALGAVRRTRWERGVVANDWFAPALPQLSILAIHDCHFVPATAPDPALVVGRVAGLSQAVYGLPEESFPILWEHREGLLVSATKLSHFVTGRYAPTYAWRRVWRRIVAWCLGGQEVPELTFEPQARPAFGRECPLPAACEQQAFRAGAQWFRDARMLVHSSWERSKAVCDSEVADNVEATIDPSWPAGDGSAGMLEGFASVIRHDGTQPVRFCLRNDCIGESAMAFALAGRVNGHSEDAQTASNLVDYIYAHSSLAGGPRADPTSPSFGLVDWFTDSGAYYGDDNARSLMGVISVAALRGGTAWQRPILRTLLANLRTTGPYGFRGNRIDEAELQENGWQHYFSRQIINPAPHYESYLWACYLWAYRATGFKLFLERAKSAIRMTMERYPQEWLWANGIQQERARMLLPLAWLVRIEDTAEHRQWLAQVAADLLQAQVECGGIREELGGPGQGRYGGPRSNAEYGTAEATMLQKNGDPIVDLLYTTNFAFLGLHEAASATGEPRYALAENRLAQFLCRIQVQSTALPQLHGAWYRGFDYSLWDYWGSNADLGWGVWSVETGWTQAWIVAVLGLRQLRTSYWELTRTVDLREHLADLCREMLPVHPSTP